MLKGKLAPPRSSRQLVERRRALDCLGEGIDLCLTVIVAPAGYGKTTLGAQWRSELIARGRSIAWMNLEQGDNDLGVFITNLCCSLAAVNDVFTKDKNIASLHQPSVTHLAETVISSLIDGMVRYNTELHIFLDDSHCLNRPDSLTFLSKLIVKSPSNIHFIIISRVALDSIITRPHRQDQVNSLDITALRFDVKEAECLLKRRVKFSADAEVFRKVMDATEGWARALQWSARTLSQSPMPIDLAGDLSDCLSDHRLFSTDFISFDLKSSDRMGMAEKMERLMLQTSILDCFNAPLARALTGMKDSAEVIAMIARQNFPLLPMEEGSDLLIEGERGWYRYHSLFRAFLCDRLIARYVEESGSRTQVLEKAWARQHSDFSMMARLLETVGCPVFDLFDLHRRAAEWYYQMGMTDQAVHHYLSVNNTGSVLDLLEDCTMALLAEGRMATLMNLVARLPKDAFVGHHRLHLNLAWCYLLTCHTKKAAQFLDALANDRNAMSEIQADELEAAQSALKVFLDDSAGIKYGAYDGKGKGEPFHIAAGCNAVIFGRIMAGDYEAGHKIITWVEQKPDLCSIYFPFIYRQCLLALIYSVEGQFEQSNKIASAALNLAEHRKGRRSAPACVAVAVLSESLYEQNQLHSLRDLLANRFDVINDSVYPDALIRAYTNGARTYWALNEPLKSAELLETLYIYGKEKNHVRVMAASLAENVRQALTHQRLDLAQNIQKRLEALVPKGCGLSFDTAGELVLLVCLSRARLDLELGYPDLSVEILDRVHGRYNSISRRRLHARVYLMRATAKLKMGAYAQSLDDFILALTVGEECGLVRSFLDEPFACEMLLKQFSGSEELPARQEAYLEGLLQYGADKAARSRPVAHILTPKTAAEKISLSPREMEIMRYLGQGLPNKRIALAMDISVETVRWHMKNIFLKLNVSDRHDATNRAKILNLI